MTDDEAAGGPPGSVADGDPEAWTRVGRGPRRRTRWDRPPHPHDWRFYVGWLGRVLIVLGVTMFLFVAYQLWGTGIEQARAQGQLENEFEQLLEANQVTTTTSTTATTTTGPGSGAAATAPVPTSAATAPPASAPAATTAPSASTAPTTTAATPTTTTTTTVAAAVPVDDQNLTVPERGDAMAYIAIPRIGVGEYVVSGVTRNDLKKGPGHFRDTPFPGQLGNAAVAGHRTTYGAPFGEIDELEPGDEIEILLTNGYQYVYLVTGREIVSPQDYHVISDSDPNRATLTLVTCDPPATSSHRLIVYAELDPTRSGPVGEPLITGLPEEPEFDEAPATSAPVTSAVSTPGSSPSSAPPGAAPPTTAATPVGAASGDVARPPAPGESDAFSEGWFAESAAWPQIGLWGAALAALVTAGWWLARFWKREWVGVLAVIAPFSVCLYFFFQNVNRLLPAGL